MSSSEQLFGGTVAAYRRVREPYPPVWRPAEHRQNRSEIPSGNRPAAQCLLRDNRAARMVYWSRNYIYTIPLNNKGYPYELA